MQLPWVADHVVLNVGDKKTLSFSLTVGEATQTVTVTSSGELINTTTADITDPALNDCDISSIYSSIEV